MAKKEQPLQGLQKFMPADAFPLVLPYLEKYHVHLTITRERKSILGDYRHALPGKNHRISVNGNLNPYSFLITLIHELAHLICFQQYAHRVPPHGKEWKMIYQELMRQFLGRDIFPGILEVALVKSLHNLPASSCSDVELARVLQTFDLVPDFLQRVEDLPVGSIFRMDLRFFRREEKLRKRIRCTDCQNGRVYLFSPIVPVDPISGELEAKILADLKQKGW